MVEKKRRFSGSMPWKPTHELSPEELNARKAALELLREREFVMRVLEARGQTVDRSVSFSDFRKGYTDTEWHALAREGLRLFERDKT